MDIYPLTPSSLRPGQNDLPQNDTLNGNAQAAPSTPSTNTLSRSRSLRARPPPASRAPIPTPSPSVKVKHKHVRPAAISTPSSSPSTTLGSIRQPTQRELDNIHRRLGAESIGARRDELLQARERELKEVVEAHDDDVREKFHLERYVTILDGWNPAHAKTDNSPVFLEWRTKSKHNLLDLLPAPSSFIPSAQAGPSRPRAARPARTTRRQAHEQSELLAQVVTPASTPIDGHATNLSAKGKERLIEPIENGTPTTTKGKGKNRGLLGETESTALRTKSSYTQGPSTKTMPPPPLPTKKGKGSRRATMDPYSIAAEEEAVEEPVDSGVKGVKRGRMSLPNLSTVKKVRTGKEHVVGEGENALPAVVTPLEEEPESKLTPTPAPEPLPSLAHLSFPPPPPRPRQRIPGSRRVWYTEPGQRPSSSPKHNGDVAPILSSYVHIDDTGNQPDLKTLEIRAARDGYLRARVMYLQQHGRLLRLIDEAEDPLLTKSIAANSHRAQPKLPPRKTDHQDSLMAHMVQVRNAMLNEAKLKPIVCKRIARMIQVYWERLEGKEERERLAEEKEKKRMGRELVKAIRKRWALAVKIIRAKVLEAQKIEQDRRGKEHLQNILQRSTGLLEAQIQAPDEDENDDLESGDTDEVSYAEDSDDEAGSVEDEGHMEQATEKTSKELSLPPTTSVASESELGDVRSDHPVETADQDIDMDEAVLNDDAEQSPEPDLRLLLPDDVDMAEDSQFDLDPDATITGTVSSAMEIEADITEASATTETSRPASLDIEAVSINPPADLPAVDRNTTLLSPDFQSQGSFIAAKHTNDLSSSPPLTTPKARSRRLRKTAAVTPIPQGDDPDENDIEFREEITSDLDEQDVNLDVEMEDADEVKGESDSEDEGLLADVDVPIEELLKRYGYPLSAANGDSDDVKDDQTANTNGDPAADKSLTDEALPVDPVSPALIVEGKRQRRPRSVWSPNETPQHLPGKRPKIEDLDDEGTPEPSSDEDDNGDESEEEEEGEEGPDHGEERTSEEDIGPRVRPPFLLRGTLRPYQQAGLEWLASLYANKMNGILADEMGLGKTIQTISLLGHLACDKGVWGQHLIIVPTSVILNWEMEFKKFLPGMKVLTYYGNQKERKEKRIGWHTENAWQVCITSYQIVLADQHIFRRKSWCYMILDEAHNIKNFRSQRWQTLLGFKAQRRLLLTGTPLQNNLMELWSLLYFLMPGGIGADATAVVGFANHKEFMEWFSNPMDKAVESGVVMDEETLATIAKLHTLLRPFILRRLKSEVETQLPGKFEHVVYCRLSKRQRFLYDEFMARASTREALTSGGYLGVMNTLMQLRKVCNHPDLFEVRPVRTSFAMESVAKDYEPAEILVRRRLIEEEDEKKVDVLALGLGIAVHENVSGWVCKSRAELDASDKLPYAIEIAKKGKGPTPPKRDTRTVEGWLKYRAWAEEQSSISRWRALRDANRRRCATRPIYGSTFLKMLARTPNYLLPIDVIPRRDEMFAEYRPPASSLIMSLPSRAQTIEPIVDLFAVIPPNAVARDMPNYALPGLQPTTHPAFTEPNFDTLHHATVKLQIAFPDASLLQYDCGKLQKLYEMLRDLKAGGHRVLIFTQMTRVLDILEMFLSYNGHRYLRLDGSTKIEDRQIITERFNSDPRIFVFIASSRSGGVGINLTGADTVFFYDSDWNPSMDRQCMDRAHRIGQTREVHIYRFVSKHTVEENMLRKAEQKRMLDRMVIQDGGFNNDWWGRVGWKDMFGEVPGLSAKKAEGENEGGLVEEVEGGEEGIVDVDVEDTPIAEDVEKSRPQLGEERELARALAEVEDEEDVQAARMALGEGELDLQEFEEGIGGGSGKARQQADPLEQGKRKEGSGTPMIGLEGGADLGEMDGDIDRGERTIADDEGAEEYDDGIGGVEEYMLQWVEADWEWFVSFRA
ncbi:hypothetical protein IAR55_001882 [Kwoniella newhampshirensis]|uniref:Helicase SWR1 n=1 Tax=Kwoniella newhampshirensis TaxID=1651941 RepID=A0AAW0Z3C4_9TREE